MSSFPRILKASRTRLVLAAAIGLALLLLVVITGRSSTQAAASNDCTVSNSDVVFDSEEQYMLQLINNYRVQNGVAPLQVSYTLSKSAQWKSQDMAVNDYFDHADLFNNNRTDDQRDADCGYGYNVWHGENIQGQGTGLSSYPNSTETVFESWKGSASHNAAMLDPDFHAVGIGRAFSLNSGSFPWLWTTDFGGYADGANYRPPLPNDNFAGAGAITALPFSDGPYSTLDTLTVTREANEPLPCCAVPAYGGSPQPCYLSGATVWYKFTPAVDETLGADLYGSDYLVNLGIYIGPDLTHLTGIGCSGGSPVGLAAQAGATYYFQAGGSSTSQTDPNTMQPYPTDLAFHLTCLSASCPAAEPPVTSPTPTPAASPSLTPAASPSPTPVLTLSTAPADVIDPITQPADGATVPAGKTIKIAATASAPLGIARVDFYVNGARKCSDSSAPYSCNWGVPTQRGVTYTLEDRAYDTAGHIASSRITVVSGVDSTPPVVSVSAPAAGASVAVNGTVTISASALDEVGVAKVDFYVNGSRKCSDSTAPYSCAWKVPSLPGVTYQLMAKAYDFAGNTSVQTISVTPH